MTKRTRLTAVTAGLVALSLSACSSPAEGGNDSTDSEEARAPELSFGLPVDLTGWAAADAAWGPESLYHQAVYDTLTRTDAEGKVEAGLATEWSYDEDKTTLTMQLRDDVTFSDGTEFTAEVAAENLERFRDGASNDTNYLSVLDDAVAEDDHTLTLELDSPDPALLSYLSYNAGLQASPETFDSTDVSTPVGSGPYEYDADASIPGSRYVFTARDGYWDEEAQHYDQLTMYYYGDTTAMLNALRDSQVDYASLHGASQITDAEAAGYTTHTAMDQWSGFIMADRDGTNHEAIGDVRVRQAFNHALDREALLEAVELGYGETTSQIFHTESPAFDEELEDAYPYDPERAKELLAEAGYPDGITISQPKTSFVPDSEYELVAGMLAESGINAEADNVGNDFFGDIVGGRWAAFQFGLDQSVEPWVDYKMAIAPDAPWNMFGVEDETVTELGDRIRAGGEDADVAAQELNQYLVDEAWFAPLYRSMNTKATADGTEVTTKSAQSQPNIWDIRPSE